MKFSKIRAASTVSVFLLAAIANAFSAELAPSVDEALLLAEQGRMAAAGAAGGENRCATEDENCLAAESAFTRARCGHASSDGPLITRVSRDASDAFAFRFVSYAKSTNVQGYQFGFQEIALPAKKEEDREARRFYLPAKKEETSFRLAVKSPEAKFYDVDAVAVLRVAYGHRMALTNEYSGYALFSNEMAARSFFCRLDASPACWDPCAAKKL